MQQDQPAPFAPVVNEEDCAWKHSVICSRVKKITRKDLRLRKSALKK
jgi:hypothetical protein